MRLIGGSSSVGKTTVARTLGARSGWQVVSLDRALPALPALDPLAGPSELWDRPAGELCDRLIAAAEAAKPHVAALLAAGAIHEGERLHPDLATALAQSHGARAVFIIEPDAARLHATLVARSPGFRTLPESRQRNVAEVDRRYGAWLADACHARGLITVPSQPWATLADRIAAAIAP